MVGVVAGQTVNGSERLMSFRQAIHFVGLGVNRHGTMIVYRNAGHIGVEINAGCCDLIRRRRAILVAAGAILVAAGNLGLPGKAAETLGG